MEHEEPATPPGFDGLARKSARALVGCLVLTSCTMLLAQSSSYLITTVAGIAPTGQFDGGPALNAALDWPTALTVDSLGNTFVFDTNSASNSVFKISPQGIITTVAGNGTAGFSGDNGPATAAQLNNYTVSWPLPVGLGVDSFGNLFIADTGNHRIREVTPQGLISTVVGSGAIGSNGGGFSGDGGPATSAQLDYPTAVTVDAHGNLWIADAGNHRIRKVTSQGIISTVAGNGQSVSSGDGGPATSASLAFPIGVAVDASGNLFIADYASNLIREVKLQGIITTVAGNGNNGFNGDGGAPATSVTLSSPMGVAVDASGNLFIDDSANRRIRMVTPQGLLTTVAGGNLGGLGYDGDGAPATFVALGYQYAGGNNEIEWWPIGIAVDSSGSVLIGDGNHKVRKLVPSSNSVVGCTYSLDQTSQNFQAAGGNNIVGVLTSDSYCPWLAGSYSAWLVVNSPTGIGSGLGLVTYSVNPNPSSDSRTGIIWGAGTTLSIAQSGVPCSFSVSSHSVPVGAPGQTGATLTVTPSPSDCQWSAAATVPWILVSGGSTGTGDGTVTFTVGINVGQQRSGGITVTGQQSGSSTLTVTQYALTDLGGTGSTTVADVQLVINEALGSSQPKYDLNFDGAVNVADVQIEINGLLFFPCGNAGPLTVGGCSLSFTNVSGQLSNGVVITAPTATAFNATSNETSCTNSAWLSISPSGPLTASSSDTYIDVQVNPLGIANLTTCTGAVTLVTQNATQTVAVSMTVGTAQN